MRDNSKSHRWHMRAEIKGGGTIDAEFVAGELDAEAIASMMSLGVWPGGVNVNIAKMNDGQSLVGATIEINSEVDADRLMKDPFGYGKADAKISDPPDGMVFPTPGGFFQPMSDRSKEFWVGLSDGSAGVPGGNMERAKEIVANYESYFWGPMKTEGQFTIDENATKPPPLPEQPIQFREFL